MNKKIALLSSIIIFQLLLFCNFFSELFNTKHNVELTYQEIQKICYENKNVTCKTPINIKDLKKEELEKIKNIKINIDIVEENVATKIINISLFCILIGLFINIFYKDKNIKEDDIYNFWMLFLFSSGCAYKFIYTYLNNITQIPFKLFLAIFLISSIVFFVLYFIFQLIFKNKSSAICSSLFCTAILINFKNFYHLEDIFSLNYFKLNPYVFFGAVILIFIFIKYINTKKIVIFLKHFISALLTIAILNSIFVTFEKINVKSNQKINIQEEKIETKTILNKNIYMIILDAYTGDTGLKYLEYDNKDFWNTLQKEGFLVFKDYTSNYNRTALSITSILNLNYLDEIKNFYLTDAIKNSNLFDILKAQNYKIFYHNPCKTLIKLPEKDIDFLVQDDDFINNNSVYFLLKDTLYENFYHYSNIKTTQDKFFDLVFANKHKKFVFAHFLMPHMPYKFDENGNEIEQKWDNITSKDIIMNRVNYISHLKYTNKEAIKIIRNIKEKDPNSIIILMGDHGARLKLFMDGEDKHIDEINNDEMILFMHYNTFLAYYNLDINKAHYKNTKTTVNFMRAFVNENFKANLQPLEDKKFFIYSNTQDEYLNKLKGKYLTKGKL